MNLSEYKDVYVFAEQRDGKVQNVALELLGKARELADATGEKVVAMLLGYGVKGEAQGLIAAGADRVLVVDDESLKSYLTEPYAEAITQIIREQKPNILLIGATTIGRDLGPRLSARNVTGLTADATMLEVSDDEAHEFRMTRPAFGGNLMATILCKDHRPQMSTVRPGVMQKLEPDTNRKGEVVDYHIDFDKAKISRIKILKEVKEDRGTVDIAAAKVLVAGGRGVSGIVDKLQPLAQALGGEVACSRALSDAGLMDHDRQVGQTGKTVRPDLYLACGISGAIQHLAGMEESDMIIAINKDKTAPIFKVADLGIVGDATKIVPLLTERLRSMGK
ncbi:MAG: electron transfer flavoprotein subunit alpha/FixB family protein [Bacteroidales bacterium]|nr:electron transfer flavoprotein subunit alpha/FixB family protein [Candidatus Colimorpha onthohippi]